VHWRNAGNAMTRSPLHGTATPAAPCRAEAGPTGEEGVRGAVQQVRAAVGEGGGRARAALGGLPRRAARRRARARQVLPPACGTLAKRGWATASRCAAATVQRSASRQRGRAGARATPPPQHRSLQPPDCTPTASPAAPGCELDSPGRAPDTRRAGRAAGPARRRRWRSWLSTWCAAAPCSPARSCLPGSSSCARWCRPASRWCAARAASTVRRRAGQLRSPRGRGRPLRPRACAGAARQAVEGPAALRGEELARGLPGPGGRGAGAARQAAGAAARPAGPGMALTGCECLRSPGRAPALLRSEDAARAARARAAALPAPTMGRRRRCPRRPACWRPRRRRRRRRAGWPAGRTRARPGTRPAATGTCR
jgi:hypothetical protein